MVLNLFKQRGRRKYSFMGFRIGSCQPGPWTPTSKKENNIICNAFYLQIPFPSLSLCISVGFAKLEKILEIQLQLYWSSQSWRYHLFFSLPSFSLSVSLKLPTVCSTACEIEGMWTVCVCLCVCKMKNFSRGGLWKSRIIITCHY